MFKNPTVILVLGAALLVWSLHDLTSPAEAQPVMLTGMHLFAALGGVIWIVFGLVGLFFGKRTSGQEKQG